MDQSQEYFPAGSIFKAVFNPKTGKFDVLDENGTRWGVSQEDADASAVFGATKEDMEKIKGDGKTISLAEEAKKHGGKLNMEQMMRLAGHDV